MKFGNFWMTTVGAGVVIAGMMTAGHAAMQSPTVLFLAGQLKIATGNTEAGLRLMNEAAAQRDSENGKVHAAEPQAKPTEVCNLAPLSSETSRPAMTKPAKTAATQKPSVVVMAKLEGAPLPSAMVLPSQIAVTPVAFRYMSESDRAQIQRMQDDVQRAQHERMKQIHRAARAMVLNYSPATMGFNPADISNIQRELPAAIGQMVQ